MELTDRENYEKRIAEKLKTSEEEKARITEEYEQITAHHSRELEKDRLALEKVSEGFGILELPGVWRLDLRDSGLCRSLNAFSSHSVSSRRE